MAKMRGLNKPVLELLTLLLLLCEARVLVSGRTHVHLINQIGSDLNVHCWSKDDDLGQHTIPSGQEYQWRFNRLFVNDIHMRTRFHCSVSWAEAYDYQLLAYESFRDHYSCGGNPDGRNHDCLWLFAPEGIYFYDYQSSIWSLRYPWPWPQSIP